MKKILFLVYMLFLLSFTIFSYLFVEPNIPFLNKIYSGFYHNNRVFASYIYVLLIIIFFSFYFAFLWLFFKRKISFSFAKMLIILSLVILFFSYPAMLSYDIFNYIATAKITFFYHENPYIVMPIELPNDSLFLFMHASNKLALYGPLWIILTGFPYLLSLGNIFLALLTFKLFIAIFFLGILWLIWELSNREEEPLILFGLNPLVLIETLVSGHNDVVMMFFALLAFYLLKKSKFFFSLLLIISSILIKYATIFILPVYIYVFFRILSNQKILWGEVWKWSAIAMYAIFFLSPIREEIYPWYFIWPFTFVSLINKIDLLLFISLGFSFGLCFRVAPFLYTRSWSGLTPAIKKIFTFSIPVVFSIFYAIKKKI